MIKIKLTKGKYAFIDNEDYELISRYTWNYGSRGYAVSSSKRLIMHRLIMNTPFGMDTDHINGNKLDNRKINLRICTRSQNLRNSKKCSKKRSSKYKGVSWDKKNNKWMTQVYKDGKSYFVGRYDDEKIAAKIYNEFAKSNFGEFAKINLC